MMDKVALKNHLFYDVSRNYLVGLEDYGVGSSSGILANSALALMVRGIVDNCKQPVAYYLVSESCLSHRLKDIVSDTLFHLESIGLNVIAFISDQGSNFMKFVNDLNVTAKDHILK